MGSSRKVSAAKGGEVVKMADSHGYYKSVKGKSKGGKSVGDKPQRATDPMTGGGKRY